MGSLQLLFPRHCELNKICRFFSWRLQHQVWPKGGAADFPWEMQLSAQVHLQLPLHSWCQKLWCCCCLGGGCRLSLPEEGDRLLGPGQALSVCLSSFSFHRFCQLPEHLVVSPSEMPLCQCGVTAGQNVLQGGIGGSTETACLLRAQPLMEVSRGWEGFVCCSYEETELSLWQLPDLCPAHVVQHPCHVLQLALCNSPGPF